LQGGVSPSPWPASLLFTSHTPSLPQIEHHKKLPRGYIGMLSVNPSFRRMGIGRHLVALAVDSIRAAGSLEVLPRAFAKQQQLH
jgi:ribosomal protein S18 acetylase RimI-like enzyme